MIQEFKNIECRYDDILRIIYRGRYALNKRKINTYLIN
ncbi:hypothetical protein SD15574_2765 [Shigella dysenteriae 155-74]|nr:hypothetical protein Sd1012_4108 [Shigella dysenteriae 1012]EFW55300.1 hypothetical protein SGB_02267 [Shigella boydii ATCC 9905]EGI93293.1 hypothetical protein SB521682_2750 [Shigella boydii 5216-82]EGI95252.1 hypothetical protein SD15574_2765 [Shigella dysenteriae 155-74]EIQ27954.1 hypothetical protein SB96558_3223 [Shigella boydii 965-58]